MKGFKRFIPIIVLLIIFILGLILFSKSENPQYTYDEHGELVDYVDDSDNSFIYAGMIVVGFYGNVLYIVWLIHRIKVEKHRKQHEAFEKSIRQAFAPVANNNKEENKKVTCKYCKSKYDKSEDKCPNCGAPPEPCD